MVEEDIAAMAEICSLLYSYSGGYLSFLQVYVYVFV